MSDEKPKKKKVEKKAVSGDLRIQVKLGSTRRMSGGNRLTVTVRLVGADGQILSEDSDFISLT